MRVRFIYKQQGRFKVDKVCKNLNNLEKADTSQLKGLKAFRVILSHGFGLKVGLNSIVLSFIEGYFQRKRTKRARNESFDLIQLGPIFFYRLLCE